MVLSTSGDYLVPGSPGIKGRELAIVYRPLALRERALLVFHEVTELPILTGMGLSARDVRIQPVEDVNAKSNDHKPRG